jgi:Cu-Zn family superoxide dismutase
MRNIIFIGIVAGLIGLFAGCNQQQHDNAMHQQAAEPTTEFTNAVAVLHPTEGNTAHGVVRFTKTAEGVKVVADVSGLTPGKHGFHIHEYGDCSAPDGTSAGGHYNPEGMEHAGPDSPKRHVGDLGNLEADADGNAHLEYVDKHLMLNGPKSIIGRGVIVHANEDDLKSQPTGNAGGRVACGVIGIAK